MKTIDFDDGFDVEEATQIINAIMSKWAVFLINISGGCWKIFNYDRIIVYEINFFVDFNDLETRIKLEDLRLNVIRHIESLRDDTIYVDNLITQKLFD